MLCYKPILVKKFWLCFESIQHFHLCGNMNRSNSALGEDWDISLRKRQSRGFRNIWQCPGVGIILIYRRAFSGLLPKMPAFFVWIRVKESAKNCRKKISTVLALHSFSPLYIINQIIITTGNNFGEAYHLKGEM